MLEYNKFDSRYDIRLARKDDIPDIMRFIDLHWKKGHIMATDRSFFEYEFLEEDGTVNFVLAIDRDKNTIESMHGFLRSSHDYSNMYVWGTFWMTLPDNMPFLGVEVYKRTRALAHAKEHLDIGANPRTNIPLQAKIFRRYTGKMDHYYMLSDRIEDFKIASVVNRADCHSHQESDSMDIVRFKSIEEIKSLYDFNSHKNDRPYKDAWYIDHRFFNNPGYDYEVYGLCEKNECVAIAVFRRQPYNNRYAIRFVDYIGDQNYFHFLGKFLRDSVNSDGCEYIDFYCHGFNNDEIERSGLVLLNEHDHNVIPNYFAPYEQKNIDIWIAADDDQNLFTKADGDQDRPNIIR